MYPYGTGPDGLGTTPAYSSALQAILNLLGALSPGPGGPQGFAVRPGLGVGPSPAPSASFADALIGMLQAHGGDLGGSGPEQYSFHPSAVAPAPAQAWAGHLAATPWATMQPALRTRGAY